jgi:hypothetical protein
MLLRKRTTRCLGAILPALAIVLAGWAGTAQASQTALSQPGQHAASPQGPCGASCKFEWKIVKVGRPYYTYGPWHDCAYVHPQKGFNKSYTCSFTGTVSNSYSLTVGVSAPYVSASVGYSVTYSSSVSGGTTYTPINQRTTYGEVEWQSQYLTRNLYEKLCLGKICIAKHTGEAHRWNQPIPDFFPRGTSTRSTSGKFTHTHWKCKNRCP